MPQVSVTAMSLVWPCRSMRETTEAEEDATEGLDNQENQDVQKGNPGVRRRSTMLAVLHFERLEPILVEFLEYLGQTRMALKTVTLFLFFAVRSGAGSAVRRSRRVVIPTHHATSASQLHCDKHMLHNTSTRTKKTATERRIRRASPCALRLIHLHFGPLDGEKPCAQAERLIGREADAERRATER